MKPKFQPRHHEAVADILKDAKAPAYIIEAFAMLFACDNPHFQPQQFRDACDPPRWEATAAGKEELLKQRAS